MALAAIALTGSSAAAQADGFGLGDRFGDALDAVQQALDFLWPDDLKVEGMNTRIGLAVGWMPDYAGSDNFRFRLLPVIDIRYKERIRLSGSTLTYTAYSSGNFQTGPLVSLRFGRRESENPALGGLGDIRNTFEVGGFVRYQTPRLLASADIRHALSSGQGLTARATIGHGIYNNGPFSVGAGFRAKWYGGKAMQTNFGITPRQAASSTIGLEAFEAGPGISEASVNFIGAYRLNETARLYGVMSYGRIFGDAANSPLVKDEGSPSQLIFGTAVTYQF